MENKEILFNIIKESWSKETCNTVIKEFYEEKNPSYGQSAITSLVVKYAMGGKIMICTCNGFSHYYNIVNNELIDLTKDQYEGLIPDYENSNEIYSEDILLNPDTKKRFKQLLTTVTSKLTEYNYEKVNSSEEINAYKDYLTKMFVFSTFEINSYKDENSKESIVFDFAAQNIGNVYHVSHDKETGRYSNIQAPLLFTLVHDNSVLPNELLDVIFNIGRNNKELFEYEKKLVMAGNRVK